MEIKIRDRTFVIGKKSVEYKNLSASDERFSAFLSGMGYSVTTSTAMKIAVVLRCGDVVAKTMASLGCHLYETTTNGRERATNHALYPILRYQPNPETTAYEFWHMYVFSLMLSNGAYAKIVRAGGRIKELWNIPPANAALCRNSKTGERYLQVTTMQDGKQITENLYDFMYTPGIKLNDTECPEDFIKIASEVLGLTLKLNNYAKDYFENGSNLGGFVTYPGKISETSFVKFKEDWQKTYSSVQGQHKWAILEGGFDLKQLENNPANAQALESRKFQIIEVCRTMGVSPHKAFELDGVNYNSIEQLNIEFWQETIDPMDERLSQTIYKDLLLTSEQKKYNARFNTNKLLKGDTAARTAYYNSSRQNGWMSANDIRDLEDMNRISAEEGGNAYLCNGNMISIANAAINKPKGVKEDGK